MKKIYIAGPDVFFPDIDERALRQKSICSSYGLSALHPVDQPELRAATIFDNNIALLREADGVVANLNPFRGAEVDTGTAFEVGVAVALRKPVVGYVSEPHSMRERVSAYFGPVTHDPDGGLWRDKDGNLVENFDLPVNLMIGISCRVVVGDFEAAVSTLKALFDSGV